ncbi:adenosylcobinamide-phosphate synthase CbiB [Methylophilus aquaticus]|uniref:Cobalamin biosynthesis protein CobD n=1 Tax=Methylophilus aquaticus TaxID=1971610 RepID=A0ABT9JR15_9PROT|nr:adenosylcobinamide-phosphate synthase CbiB [Methylophilus aquaticus]MDP8567017.1 adenosylcobinamide-phosphate synthase CbiB [Methylophilus aquaticus]
MFSLPAYSLPDYLTLAGLACGAVLLDDWLGEPKRWHPLVGFGWLVNQLEKRLNPAHKQPFRSQYLRGAVGIILLVLPPILAIVLLMHLSVWLALALHVYLLYFAIGHRSLRQHGLAVYHALQAGQFQQAQRATSYMVSRDVEAIEPVSATIESLLENGNDSVFGTLFWFFVAGGPGALAYRLVNTLDAMWGYKTARYFHFGWAAARLDDVLNYIPARLTAITYALLGHTRLAWQAWRTQAPLWDSPNAGPVMAAGAGALNVQLGGRARYHGEWHDRPRLGTQVTPTAEDIPRALQLVRRGMLSWLSIALLLGALPHA